MLKPIFCLDDNYTNTYLPSLFYQNRYSAAKFYSESRRLIGENFCDYLQFRQTLGTSDVSRFWTNDKLSEKIYLMAKTKTVKATWSVRRNLQSILPPNSELKVVVKTDNLENHLVYDIYGNNVVLDLPFGDKSSTEGCFILPSYFTILLFYTNIPSGDIVFDLLLEDYETPCFTFDPYLPKKYCIVKKGKSIPCFEIRSDPQRQGSFEKIVFPAFKKYAASVRAEFLSNIYVECLEEAPLLRKNLIEESQVLTVFADIRNLTRGEATFEGNTLNNVAISNNTIDQAILGIVSVGLINAIGAISGLIANTTQLLYGSPDLPNGRPQTGVNYFNFPVPVVNYGPSVNNNLYVDLWLDSKKFGPNSLIKNYQDSAKTFELERGIYTIDVDIKLNFLRRAYYDPKNPGQGKFNLGPLYNPDKPVMFAMVGWHGYNRPKLQNEIKNPKPVSGYEDKVCSYFSPSSTHDLELKATYKIDHDGNGWQLAFSILDGCYLLTSGGVIGSTFNMSAKDFSYTIGDPDIKLIEPSVFSITITKNA